jgi:spore maturation protein CgeB
VGVKDGHEVHVEEAYSLGPRAFEIAACGAFQLCDDTRAELDEIFKGSVPTYSGPDELRAKAQYFMTHDQDRRDLAWESYQRVQGCAFVNRAQEIVLPALERIL